MANPIPDWKLPPGTDRGLWDYLHSTEMIDGYDEQMDSSPLAAVDIRFCEEQFSSPGRLIDLGCGTGRMAKHFAMKGFDCVGVDLSEEMLKKAKESAGTLKGKLTYQSGNLTNLSDIPAATFDYAACLFSTLGMIRGEKHRRAAVAEFFRILKLAGRLVLHVHNRYFLHGLGWKGFFSGDVTMPQAYGGAPLTLHHFGKRETLQLLTNSGFRIQTVKAVGLTDFASANRFFWQPYGYLIAVEK